MGLHTVNVEKEGEPRINPFPLVALQIPSSSEDFIFGDKKDLNSTNSTVRVANSCPLMILIRVKRFMFCT